MPSFSTSSTPSRGWERRSSKLSQGDPELAAVVASVNDLQGRLERVRGVLGPLISDANREPSADEKTAASLERALASLRQAAQARQSVG